MVQRLGTQLMGGVLAALMIGLFAVAVLCIGLSFR